MMPTERPPLGLIPKEVWQSKRFKEVCEAITRYYTSGFQIPLEWVEEYNELVVVVK